MNRKTLAAIFVALLGAMSSSVLGAPAPKVDLFGFYYFGEPGAPRGFQDVDHLHLSTIDVRNGAVVDVPLHGFIRMKAQGQKPAVDFPLVSPTLKGKAFTFTTQEVGGVSYRFAGSFLKLGNFPEERPEDEVVLAGRLTRLKGGKAVAAADVKLRYTGGD